jgi:integrase
MRTKITLRVIAEMPSNSIIWDTEIPGLNVRRQHSEVVTYSIVYRTLDGVQRWQRVGRHGVWTPDLARRQARSVLMARDLGKDPSADRMALRSAPTVSELCDEYSARDNGKKPATIRSDTSRIKLHIKPKLGKLKVASVTSDHVEDFMRSMPIGSQGRTVGLLGAIFSYAVKRKLITVNPCVGVEKPTKARRSRRLSDAEYAQLGAALKGGIISDIFLLLAVTGWRSSEAKNLRWEECDLERSIVTLGDTKTGVSIRPLSAAAIEIIKRQKQNGSTFVFDQGHGMPINVLRHNWLKLGMPQDVTPHVMRHSFASLAADLGLADSTIAGLIGHKQQSMTSRYLHLDKTLVSAANLVATETLKLMKIDWH